MPRKKSQSYGNKPLLANQQKRKNMHLLPYGKIEAVLY